jgi:hypothetical protein
MGVEHEASQKGWGEGTLVDIGGIDDLDAHVVLGRPFRHARHGTIAAACVAVFKRGLCQRS